MTHRFPLVASVLFSLLAAACGSTVNVPDEGDDGDGGGGTGGDTSGVPTSTAAIATTGTSVVGSTGIGTSVVASSGSNVTTSTGSGGFGEPDLYPQDLGAPSNDRNLFEIAPNALGAMVFGRAPSDMGTVWLERLTAPSGSIALDGYVPSNEHFFYNYGVASMVMPQFDHPELYPLVTPGTWSLRVSETSISTNVTVLERRTVDGAFHGGVLDVNVFVVPGVADPDYLLSQIQNGFSNWAGIGLGEVRFFDIGDEFFEVNDSNYYDVMHATASAPTGQAATFVVVGYIGGSLEGAAGFSPGAPADPIGHGSNASTIVWMMTNSPFDATIVGHEAGHFAGLSHTTEFEGGFEDALADTPSCPDIAIGLEPPFDFSFCGDFGHLMFPTGGSGAHVISPQQEKTLRASAIYRGIYEPGGLPAAPYQDLLGGQPITPRSGASAPRALTLDGVGSTSRSSYATATPPALRASLPPEVAALDGFGCGANGAMSALIDGAAASTTASELIDLARDERAVPMFRMRALLAASRATDAASFADDFASIAEDPSYPEHVRAGAIRALARVAPQKHATTVPVLRGDTSRLVRHLASK
jgi:hypothetical protein